MDEERKEFIVDTYKNQVFKKSNIIGYLVVVIDVVCLYLISAYDKSLYNKDFSLIFLVFLVILIIPIYLTRKNLSKTLGFLKKNPKL